MTTGAYVRIQREGKWVNVEIDQMTDAELDTFEFDHPSQGSRWAKFLAKWIRDNVQVEDDGK